MNSWNPPARGSTSSSAARKATATLRGPMPATRTRPAPAVWIAEYAAELKQRGRTLVDALDEIYAAYGYCHNYLTEIRLLGAMGMEQIAAIMDHFRGRAVERFGDFTVEEKLDRWQGAPQPHLSETTPPPAMSSSSASGNVAETTGLRVTVRPSGTNPRSRCIRAGGKTLPLSDLAAPSRRSSTSPAAGKDLHALLLRPDRGDFPERGFLCSGSCRSKTS